jgi:hypothetical protein
VNAVRTLRLFLLLRKHFPRSEVGFQKFIVISVNSQSGPEGTS